MDSIYKKNVNINNLPCEISKHINDFFTKPKAGFARGSLGTFHPKNKRLFFKSEYPDDLQK